MSRLSRPTEHRGSTPMAAGHPQDAVPEIECPNDRHLARDQPQGNRQRPLLGRGSLCAAAQLGDARRRDPARGGAALSLQQPPALRRGFAGVARGIARSTLDAFVELARDKVPFRSGGVLRDNHLIQSQIAQAEARLAAARAFLLCSLEEITAELARAGHITLDQRMEIRLASTFCHPPVIASRRHRLPRRRVDGDLRGEPVRAPLPRYPHRIAALAGPVGTF